LASLTITGNHSCDPNLWWVDAYTLAAFIPELGLR
jgi:hypothetical protein